MEWQSDDFSQTSMSGLSAEDRSIQRKKEKIIYIFVGNKQNGICRQN